MPRPPVALLESRWPTQPDGGGRCIRSSTALPYRGVNFLRLLLVLSCAAAVVSAAPALPADASAPPIPATPLMTVYRFNGALDVPYYAVESFLRDGATRPAGTIAQGSSVLPCLVVRDGKPVTDASGTPFVGFEVVVDARTATPESTAVFEAVDARRKASRVENHHCPPGIRFVLDIRRIFDLGKPPRFDPARPAGLAPQGADGELDEIVRAFHASPFCEAANRRLIGRKAALERAWGQFVAEGGARWPASSLRRARQLDFVLRTALFEGHLDRGCSAYGACERNAIVLSIRNRARERCLRGQGCREPGDFEGVATKVSQYNIWDEFLAQTSGLTACFLRPDLRAQPSYGKLQAMYEQSRGDAERILFGDDGTLARAFPANGLADLRSLRHYYHPPAMGKCFPGERRLEYMSGAVARRGNDFALIANTRIHVGRRVDGGYHFQQALVDTSGDRDFVTSVDLYPGFVVDARKVSLQPASRCTPYGTSARCRHGDAGRHRRTPSWLASGKPLALTCAVRARGEQCSGEARQVQATVGGLCDKDMQTVAGVP